MDDFNYAAPVVENISLIFPKTFCIEKKKTKKTLWKWNLYWRQRGDWQEFSQADAANGSKTWMFLQQLLNKHEILFLFRLTRWVWIRWVSIQKWGADPSLISFLQRSPLQAGLWKSKVNTYKGTTPPNCVHIMILNKGRRGLSGFHSARCGAVENQCKLRCASHNTGQWS